MQRKLVLLSIIFIQILVVINLAYTIYSKSRTLGISTVNPIKKEELIFDQTSKYKYYYEPSPNDQRNDLEYKSISTINSDSLNDRYDYSTEKKEDAFRIITLGDSFTYGLHVNTNDTWPEKLEDLLRKRLVCSNIRDFEVLNLGVEGYDVAYSAYRYEKRGAKYNPDLIIWMLIDGLRNTEKIRESTDYLHFDAKKWIEAREQVIKTEGEKKISSTNFELLDEFIRKNTSPNKIFITVPFFDYYVDYNWGNIFNKLTAKYSKVKLFKTQDFHKMGGSFLPKDTHPNEKGYQIIAEDVYNYLVSNKLIPCTK